MSVLNIALEKLPKPRHRWIKRSQVLSFYLMIFFGLFESILITFNSYTNSSTSQLMPARFNSLELYLKFFFGLQFEVFDF